MLKKSWSLPRKRRNAKRQRRKKQQRRRKKEKEAADKDETSFEAWKKEEKAEYEAWKKEKQQLEEQMKADKAKSEAADIKPAALETKDASTSVAEDKASRPAEAAANSSVTEVAIDAIQGPTELKQATAAPEAELISKTSELKVDDAAGPSDDDEAEHTPDEGPENHSRASSRTVSRGRRLASHMYRNAPRSSYGDELSQEADPRARLPVDDKLKAWNAVCVLGLRVYSQDSEVSIKLLKPKNVEEGAILDFGGETAAGATM